MGMFSSSLLLKGGWGGWLDSFVATHGPSDQKLSSISNYKLSPPAQGPQVHSHLSAKTVSKPHMLEILGMSIFTHSLLFVCQLGQLDKTILVFLTFNQCLWNSSTYKEDNRSTPISLGTCLLQLKKKQYHRTCYYFQVFL